MAIHTTDKCQRITLPNPPVGKGMKRGEGLVSIIDLIPIGKENAISRKMLTAKCVGYGLIADSIKDKDRQMRHLIEIARKSTNTAILNNSDGEGYFIPSDSLEDALAARSFVIQERKKAKEIVKGTYPALRVYNKYIEKTHEEGG